MSITIKLERLDGTPADPPQFRTGVYAWEPGHTIPIKPGKMLQVVRVARDDAADQAVLVVQDVSETASSEGAPGSRPP